MKTTSDGVILPPEALESLINLRPSIKLSTFSKVFFPMFVTYLSDKPVDLRAWFYATNTKGTVDVDVVDKDGSVVFVVPAIFSTSRREFGVGLTKDPADIMSTAQRKDREVPGAGNRYIEANLTNSIDYDEHNEKEQRKYMEDWVKIFNYYGYEHSGKVDQAKSNEDDDLDWIEYDEI